MAAATTATQGHDGVGQARQLVSWRCEQPGATRQTCDGADEDGKHGGDQAGIGRGPYPRS